MRAFTQKENQPQERVSSSRVRSNTAAPGSHRADTATTSPRSGHDISRVPLHPPAAVAIQTKLEINQPGDDYEREADHVSEQVMRMPERQLRHACPCGGGCPRCQREHPGQEHERLQTKRLQSGDLDQGAVPPVVHEVLASPGQPLDAATRAFMEPRFSHDFSQVRIHADTRAAESAEAVKARAYTVGQHVVLAEGQPTPETIAGRQLWAHELAHVVQQSRGGGGPAPEVSPSAPHERDAHAAAMAVAIGLPSVRITSNTGVGLARTNGDAALAAAQAELDALLRDIGLRDIVLGELGGAPGIPLGARLPVAGLEEKLERVIAKGGPKAEAAQRYLERLRDIRARLRNLSPVGAGTQFKGGGERGGRGSATKTGFARKLGFLLDAAFPGPLDVLDLYIGFFGSIAEAKEKLRNDYYSLGFSEGFAAKLLGFDPTKLIKPVVGAGVGERVAGFEGVRQHATNQGVFDGYVFVRRLNYEQRGALLKQGFAVLANKGQRVGTTSKVGTYYFNFDDVLALGLALKPTLDQMLEVAREQEAARLRRLEEERRYSERPGWARD